MEGSKVKGLYAAMAKANGLRKHAEECNRQIAERAGSWLETADKVAERFAGADAADPAFNAKGFLGLARGRSILRRLRDGA